MLETTAGQRRWIAIMVAALLAFGAITAASSGEAHAATAKQLKKKAFKRTKGAVKKELTAGTAEGLAEPGAAPKVKVSSCKTKKSKFKCSWSAKGEAAGRVPIHCSGKAVINKTAKKVKRLDPCNNTLEEQAPLLANPHPVTFGYFEDWATQPLFGKLKAGGAQVARVGLNWKALQPNAPQPNENPQTAWSWSGFDSIAASLKSVGVRPVWTLTDSPCWATPSCGGESNAPSAANIPDYAKAAAEVAKRYPESAAIEVWQEPNGVKFWGATPDPQRFSAMVGQAADAVAATGTGVPVTSGGLAPGAASPDKLVFDEFIRQAVAAGGIKKAAGIGFHAVTEVPFSSGNDPTTGYLGRLRIQVKQIEDALASGGSTQPIVLTQLSYSTVSYTEAQQAEALTSSLAVASKLASVPTVIVSRLFDNGDGSKVSGFGVLNPNGTPKPAYCQLATQVGAPSAC